jgi:hypothetical protein
MCIHNLIGLAVVRRMLQARVTQKVKEIFRSFMVDLKNSLEKCAVGLARWTAFKINSLKLLNSKKPVQAIMKTI